MSYLLGRRDVPIMAFRAGTWARIARSRLALTPLRIPLTWYRHSRLDRKDFFVGGYPRSGTTWLRFMLYEALTGRSAGFEVVLRAIPDMEEDKGGALEVPTGGRILKTHEPWRREYRRAVCVIRDVRAVVCSSYRYALRRLVYAGSFERFVFQFMAGRTSPYGSWRRNVASWLRAAEDPLRGVHVLRFEDLREDPEGRLRDVLRFLGVEVDGRRIRSAVRSNTVEAMRRKEDAEALPRWRGVDRKIRFVHRGRADEWKELLSRRQIRRIETWAGGLMGRLGYPPSSHAAE